MITQRIVRGIFYTTNRIAKKRHADCRDLQTYYQSQKRHEDSEYMIHFFIWSFKQQLVTGILTIGTLVYLINKSKRLREKFEIRYLTQMPVKEYEPSDYDYKYWELLRTKPENNNHILNTDAACRDHYVLLYHAETSGSHIPMQRFARAQKYIELRKDLPIKSVYVAMDDHIDPDFLQDYADQYSKDLVACYPSGPDIKKGLENVFQNLGCIYVLERGTGNVIYIIDPNKHPLEAIGTRLIFTISKNIDFRVSKEIIEKNINVKSGHDDELRPKAPTY